MRLVLTLVTYLVTVIPCCYAFIFEENIAQGGCTLEQQNNIRKAGNEVMDHVWEYVYNKVNHFNAQTEDFRRNFGNLFDINDRDHITHVRDVFSRSSTNRAFFHILKIYCNDNHLTDYIEPQDGSPSQWDPHLQISTGMPPPDKTFIDPDTNQVLAEHLSDCQWSGMWAAYPAEKRPLQRITEAYTYGLEKEFSGREVDVFATVVCPQCLMFGLPESHRTMDAVTYRELIDEDEDLEGADPGDINILSNIMLHEVEYSGPLSFCIASLTYLVHTFTPRLGT
ncbi:hypothetical protein K440DRAFT_678805 [Wilcoxina mikolae CBS 423.85]|nr:hypothetical protein K440DRAFT_678805 [Wilcoxina mikolae CBS 423.85]